MLSNNVESNQGSCTMSNYQCAISRQAFWGIESRIMRNWKQDIPQEWILFSPVRSRGNSDKNLQFYASKGSCTCKDTASCPKTVRTRASFQSKITTFPYFNLIFRCPSNTRLTRWFQVRNCTCPNPTVMQRVCTRCIINTAVKMKSVC